MRSWAALALGALTACGGASATPLEPAPRGELTLTVVGTNDLHGRVGALPVLGGYLEVLRALRSEDGALVVLDGGDMFQGTLESNLLEGAPVVEAYGALGYDAVTIGNHEFDYGPVGEAAVARGPGQDPRGALLARAAEASYPFLAANLRREGGGPLGWPHVRHSALLERAGVTVGVIGVTTEDTLTTTIAANVRDLELVPVADAIAAEARSLRDRGAAIVLVAAHAGGRCERFEAPRDLSSCDPEQEIFRVAAALPEGAVDAIVAGHTHQAIAHVVAGIPIVESYAYGRAFGRVDLVVDRARGAVVRAEVHPPRELCAEGTSGPDCAPGTYEGREVRPDPRIAAVLAPAIANAASERARPLGVTIADGPIEAVRERECALGNLFTDLMREARGADVGLTNGGGLRASLPVGPLTYGLLHEATPFDNAIALVRLSRRELEALLADNLGRTGSFLSVSGVRVRAGCEGGELRAHVTREDGTPIGDDATLLMVTSDFLATGDEAAFAALRARAGAIEIDAAQGLREAMAARLTARGGTLRPADLYDPARPRVAYEGTRPLSCAP
ncbi:MAG: 5'-nucleotidase C-terminal domain-containing protein [Sandaracinaceae bacterium]|nr:5'-nucleotidase C-terminal domain-containing protein [Sandaracinaceae bacterium]